MEFSAVNRRRPSRETPLGPGAEKDGCFRRLRLLRSRWTPFSTLKDLDFADDLALLSHTRQHIQEKTGRLSIFSNQVGLKISLKKTENMCVNVPSPTEIRVRGQGIPYTDKFTYLGSLLCQDGGTGVDIQNRLNKAINSFTSLRSVWRLALKLQHKDEA